MQNPKTLHYEWITEVVDMNSGDILDVRHRDVADALPMHLFNPDWDEEGTYRRFALVCDDADGIRSWAYVNEGVLDAQLKDASDTPTRDTPQRFLALISGVRAVNLKIYDDQVGRTSLEAMHEREAV